MPQPSFEDLKPGSRLRGLDPAGIAEVVQISRFGPDALNLVFRVDGRVRERLVYRGEETAFEFVEAGRTYAFDADGGLLRLASEAYRIRLAHLFDPYLAVHASQIEALPHQITAVYGEMLPRQPLRFLLADDPGAGKTIMAGLLVKELLIRGDLERCLIVAPGSLVEQWQDEMAEKFGLGFDLITRDQIEASVTGNPFVERNRLIVRLDMAARSDELKAKLEAAPDWDLVVCDEAHRMAASYFSGEVKETRRHKLGRLLGTRTRNFLLMSATPHNGKEADFQLFMGLLDADRFEGRFREGVHKADVSDMMRRLTKEELYRFGHPLLEAAVDVVLERFQALLQQGAVLIDETDEGTEPRLLVYLEHAVRDGRTVKSGEPRVVSQRLQFIFLKEDGSAQDGGPAPYLDCRPIAPEEKTLVGDIIAAPWLSGGVAERVLGYAIASLVPEHLAEVKRRRLGEIDEVESEVRARLNREINYWDARAARLREEERAGKEQRVNAQNAEATAARLVERLHKRQAELDRERQISALPPVLKGAALVVPAGFLKVNTAAPVAAAAPEADGFAEDPVTRAMIEKLAMDAVMAAASE